VLAPVVALSLASWTCAEEDARVRAHLEDALTQLQTTAPPIDPQRRERRAEALRVLRRYIDADRFPRNHSARPATPVFVDDEGTHCAMGAVIAELGGEAIVRHVRASRNLATVAELADEPGLLAWLRHNGLTAEEAALVQPSYFRCEPQLPLTLGTSASYDGVILPAPDAVSPRQIAVLDVHRGDAICRGDRHALYSVFWPTGARVWFPRELATDGTGWVLPALRSCSWRPVLDEEDRAALADQNPPLAKLAPLIAKDPRWLVAYCTRSPGLGPFCDATGRIRSAVLPPPGTMRDEVRVWFERHYAPRGDVDAILSDAGIDLSVVDALEREAWALSDDGGASLDAGPRPPLLYEGCLTADTACFQRRDGGTPDAGACEGPGAPGLPRGCGCHAGGAPLVLLLALWLSRRGSTGSASCA